MFIEDMRFFEDEKTFFEYRKYSSNMRALLEDARGYWFVGFEGDK